MDIKNVVKCVNLTNHLMVVTIVIKLFPSVILVALLDTQSQ